MADVAGNHLVRGVRVTDREARASLETLPEMLAQDLAARDISPELVISACERLAMSLDRDAITAALAMSGMDVGRARALIEETLVDLSREALYRKLERELGKDPFEEDEAEPGVWERYEPLGVLLHIAAGNAAGLPAVSVLEGLLAGNINLLKLPGSDGGLSVALLSMLIDIEPKLAPYIYVYDFPSTDVESIKALLTVSDGVAVWGGDFAVSGIRALAPPGVQLIEWGHRLSFGYVTVRGETADALHGLARDICATEQLLCSSPQCVYFESEDREALAAFGKRFASALAEVSPDYAYSPKDIHVQAEITATLELARMEEVLGEKAVIADPGYGWNVIIDYKDNGIRPSPMYRNVWVKGIARDNILPVLRPQKGYMQTAGLACAEDELADITARLFKAGVHRVTACGGMGGSYTGEPHDGQYALRRYTRRVNVHR